jgi:hypothetical protein
MFYVEWQQSMTSPFFFTMIDELYSNVYVTLFVGLLCCTLILLADELQFAMISFRVLLGLFLAFIASCVLYRSNPTLCFMIGVTVSELAIARARENISANF